jgi:O-antigen ligase
MVFFASFFIGHHVLERGYFFIDVPHIVFILFISGYYSKYFSGKKNGLVGPPYPTDIFKVLVTFFIVVFIFSLLNFRNHPAYENKISLWYLCNFVLVIVAFQTFSGSWAKSLKDHIINLILILSAIEIPIVCYQVLKLPDYSLDSTQTIKGTFITHHAMLANMLTFSLCFSVYKLFEKSNIGKKIWYGILSFSFLSVLIFSGSRSNLVGILGAGIILLILKIKFKPIHFVYLAGISIGLVLCIKLTPLNRIVYDTFHSSYTGSLDMSSYLRLFVWKGAVQYFAHAPLIEKLFGVGIANMMTIPYPSYIFYNKHVGGAHNNYLHVLLETGIVGLILFLVFFILVLIRLYRQGKNDRLALSYFIITLSLLFSGMTQETFWFQPAFGLLWLYYICLLAMISNPYQ